MVTEWLLSTFAPEQRARIEGNRARYRQAGAPCCWLVVGGGITAEAIIAPTVGVGLLKVSVTRFLRPRLRSLVSLSSWC